VYDIFALVYFSLNLPGETMETLKESIGLAEQLCALYPPSRIRIMNSCHTLDPLSPMAVHPEKYGITLTMQGSDRTTPWVLARGQQRALTGGDGRCLGRSAA